MATRGMVATSQPLAAQAGLDVLKQGGNAVDAAIAAAAVLCVVEPCSTGVGGDAFALIWIEKDKKLYGLNASGPAPAALTAEHVRALGHEQFPTMGGLTVTVPGSVRGWELALRRFGTRGLDTLLHSALSYTRDGFPVSEAMAQAWKRAEPLLGAHADSRRAWLLDGRAPRAGERFCNPEFASTFSTLAEQGCDAFYEGRIAEQIAQTVVSAGGLLSVADMADYRAEWVEPIEVAYRDGYSFHEIPPNGQGLTALLALQLVKGFDVRAMRFASPACLHLQMEAIKLAFADAQAFIADPKHAVVPVEGLLSERYTARRRALIDPGKAGLPQAGDPTDRGETVYLTVADGEGNMVSWIQSLYRGFGSGLTAGDTGVLLHCRGANFSLVPGHPNEAAGGKRPYHTIIPGFITRHGRAWSSFGVMGAFMQPQGHLQVGCNLIDFEMSPQAALDAPRFNWLDGKRIAMEAAFDATLWSELGAFGHELVPRSEASKHPYGGGQVIVRDAESGVLIGGSEPRGDGAAVGY